MLLTITKVKPRQSRSTIKMKPRQSRSTIKINYYQEHKARTTHVQNNKKSDKINFIQQNGVLLSL